MQVSARILGQEYGMTAQEMNCALEKLGFLVGEPGNYSPTEKAMEYVVEKDFHRGCGGYSWYNRYWTTRTFDDSIKDALNITPELKAEIRSELSAVRLARAAERAASSAKAEADFLASQAAKEAAEKTAVEAEEAFQKNMKNLKKAGLIGLGIAAAVGAGYGIYKAVPHVKKWWNDRKQKNNDVNSDDEETE